MTYSGYLTQVKEMRHGNYELKIPNNEIKTVFKDIIANLMKNKKCYHKKNKICPNNQLQIIITN